MLDAEEATQQARAVVTRDAGCQVDSDGDVVMAAGQSEGNVSSNWSELSWSVSLAIVRPATALGGGTRLLGRCPRGRSRAALVSRQPGV